tara:strand:- start:393 stop:689 length:297 start_codon:yes stop_codon:yes gene_type:complete
MKNSLKVLEDLDKLLLKIGDDFGPAVLEELKYRIDKTITDFNNEVTDLLDASFKKNKKTYKEFIEFKDRGSDKSESKEITDEDADVPNFIRKHSASRK